MAPSRPVQASQSRPLKDCATIRS
ncbi:EspF repeat-containing protein [Bosea rubneri]